MKIIIDDKIPFIKGALEKVAEVIYMPGKEISPADVKDADALIIRTRTTCDAELLEGSDVKFIATATIGFDHIDTEYCERNGITWTNAPGCNSSSVEQYIVSALLTLSLERNLTLKNTVLGIVGVGNVGSKVANAANALGCRVLLNDPPRAASEGVEKFTDLKDILKDSDIVTLHVPLNENGVHKTLNIADKDFFGQMKDGAIFINTSRGEVVDETALKISIDEGRISAAILDVFRNEPAVDPELLSMLSIATPHIAGYSTDGKANGTGMSIRALSRFFKLGLDDWHPANIPSPGTVDIFADASEEREEEMIRQVYDVTYSIRDDHELFTNQPGSFEDHRGNYGIRRESHAYNVRMFNDDGKYRSVFEGLGFNVLADSCY